MINCPKCSSTSGVLQSRLQDDNTMWRRRRCDQCGHRWSTREIDNTEWREIQAGRKRRQKAQKINGRKSADARRGFTVPVNMEDEFNYLRRNKGMSSREAARMLGIIKGDGNG